MATGPKRRWGTGWSVAVETVRIALGSIRSPPLRSTPATGGGGGGIGGGGPGWGGAVEPVRIALGSIRSQPLRSTLAIVGVVIGIVTVVVVTSVLAGLRNQVALLFREFGTDNRSEER